MSGAPRSEPAGTWQPHLGSGSVSDDLIARAIEVVEWTEIATQVEVWEQEGRKGPGGRPRTFPLYALLVGLVVVARLGEPVHLQRVADLLFYRLSATMRAELGIPEPPAVGDRGRRKAMYRRVRTRFHGLLRLADPSDRPKNRRLTEDVYQLLLRERSADRSDADRDEAYDRLLWIVNRLLEASFLMLPRRYRRRWNGSVCVDATVVPAFARPERRALGKKGRRTRPVLRRSTDPDCGYYVRSVDDRDDELELKGMKPPIWGYEASLVVCAHVTSRGEPELPVLVVAMPPLHRPGAEPGRNAVRALANLRGRGHRAGRLAADNNYSAAKAEDYQLPTRALGYELVLSYRIDQLGIQGQSNGLILVEGRWYCPSMPVALINATTDLRKDRIDEETYRRRIEARRDYEAKAKGQPDAEGHQRFLCPAAQGAPTAQCPLKPKTAAFGGRTPVEIRPTKELRERPPKCCKQETVTVPPSAGAKFFQSVPYATPEHEQVYAGLRSSVEGLNGFLKDSAFEGMAEPLRRRVRGVAAQSILVAFQIVAGNWRKIDGFLQRMADVEVSEQRVTRTRRRSTDAIQTWLPRSSSTSSGRAPPDSP
ncbi:MAG: hypothetical protein WB565_06510 [Acidimicrobiales bacterium]